MAIIISVILTEKQTTLNPYLERLLLLIAFHMINSKDLANSL
jgi:hypothetical protein